MGVPACVLPGTPCVKGAPQREETTCAREAARVCKPPRGCETPRVSAPVGVSDGVCVGEAPGVSERPCVGRVTACVRSLYTREMSVAIREHATVSPVVSMSVVCSMSLVTRGSVSARVAWRQRLRRAKCRVAAVVANGTVPGLHGRARIVRTVPRARPPRARLRESRPGPETHAVVSSVARHGQSVHDRADPARSHSPLPPLPGICPATVAVGVAIHLSRTCVPRGPNCTQLHS